MLKGSGGDKFKIIEVGVDKEGFHADARIPGRRRSAKAKVPFRPAAPMQPAHVERGRWETLEGRAANVIEIWAKKNVRLVVIELGRRTVALAASGAVPMRVRATGGRIFGKGMEAKE
ncbi:hypothetical protein LBMAG56_44230 [Verrucomicrobiota bacterium]|nr:hypothetical protein LBMAG56_44230 [Verrucomicrobiota bacterium]